MLRTTWLAYHCGREFLKDVTKDNLPLRYHVNVLLYLQSTLVLLALENMQQTRLRSSGTGGVTDKL